MKKKKILSLLLLQPISIMLFAGIWTWWVQFSCGCITGKDIIEMNKNILESYVNEQKESKWNYPTYEELEKAYEEMEDESRMGNYLYNYDEDNIDKWWVYYSLDWNNYTLKAYATGTKSYFLKWERIFYRRVLTDLETNEAVKYVWFWFYNDLLVILKRKIF